MLLPYKYVGSVKRNKRIALVCSPCIKKFETKEKNAQLFMQLWAIVVYTCVHTWFNVFLGSPFKKLTSVLTMLENFYCIVALEKLVHTL